MEAEQYKLMQELEGKHWWFVSRRKIIDKVISKLSIPVGADILEIGCGSGGNLSLLSKYGNVYASELNEDAIEIAKNRNVAKAVEGAALPEDNPFKEKKFDLVVMFDVLEHIDNDGKVLKALKEKLKPSGILIITVPAMQFLWSKHDEECHHKRRYNKKSALKLFNLEGYKVNYFSYFNFWLFPIVFLLRFKNRIVRADKKVSDLYMPNNLVNIILKWIFSSESLFIPKISFPFGVSLIVVASNK